MRGPLVEGPDPEHAFRERIMPLLLAALAMGFVVISIQPYPVGVLQDDGIYVVLARSLATGQGYRFLHLPDAPNATHYPPLYPLFLAGLWKLVPAFPANVTVFKFANAALVAVAAAGAYRFTRARAGLAPAPAALTVAAFTACAPIVLLGVMVLSEPLFLAALCPVLLVCERAADGGRPRAAVLAGAAGGVLALIRTLGVVAIPATALVLAWRRRWTAAALVVVAGALVLLPWQLWVSAYGAEVPPIFQGKYGSYGRWLAGALQAEGPGWVVRLVLFNLGQIVGQGWETLGVDTLPALARWTATVMATGLFAVGWWRLVGRAPVAAWMLAMYLSLVVAWPFLPARFTWAMWPVIGVVFGLAIDAVVRWRPALPWWRAARIASVAVAALLAVGYARFNYLGARRDWWSQVQGVVANRARPLAEWVAANTPGDAVLATDDDVLMYLYTGRRAVPNGTFTPQEYLAPQTPAFATETLRTILRTYDVDYVLASSDFGAYAANGLVQSDPPELRILGALKVGAVFVPVRLGVP
ncbi:MAG TPA: hypothetical protein VF981_04480 [Gemmatimonadaceae bacterium]